MAAISITAASVVKGSDATVVQTFLAGEAVTAGQCVYLKGSDDRWWLAQCDGTAAEAAARGIALNGAAAGQPVAVQTAGTITIGGTVVVGTVYCVGATYGAVVPWSDLASTNKLTILGYASAAGTLTIAVNATGVAVA